MTSTERKRELRRSLKEKRRALSEKQQDAASRAMAVQARKCHYLHGSKRVLAYAPFAGEIDPLQLLKSLNAEIYLPRILNYRNGTMQFFQLSNSTGKLNLAANSLGISEPSTNNPRLPARYFDAVLVPLVAFDRSGNRLGMGAGFYDRAFSFRISNAACPRPRLIGLGHGFQEVDTLFASPWDVPLDVIITDRELIYT